MTSQGYARPELLVDTEWLAERLDDPNVRVVDCGQFPEYSRAHIRNAVGIPVHHYVKEPGYERDPRAYPLVMPPGPFAELMESMGIGHDTTVVTYDDSGCLYAARVWWVLNHYGHTNVKVLNGGWKKWFDEGRPVSVDAPQVPRARFTPRTDPGLVCSLDYGRSKVGDKDTIFLDVRSDGEWEGTNDRGNKRAGHIPGAVHLEWLNFVEPDRYRMIKPASELRAMLQEHGVTPEKQVITY